MFGDLFIGVFPSNRLPKFSSKNKYAIVNLDKHNEPGSHWIALAYDNKKNKIFVYDSFGRPTKEILPSAYEKYDNLKDSDYDAEQKIFETDCGARSFSWLWVFHNYGSSIAKTI